MQGSILGPCNHELKADAQRTQPPRRSNHHPLPRPMFSSSLSLLCLCSSRPFVSIFGPWHCLESWRPNWSHKNKPTTMGSRGDGKEGDSEALHRTQSYPHWTWASLFPSSVSEPQGPSLLPPGSKPTDRSHFHLFLCSPCSWEGSFPQPSTEQAHLPLPTHRPIGIHGNRTFRHRKVPGVGFQASFHLSV